MLKSRRIVLIGFMGAGKSTVARRLGEILSWPAVDLDNAVEQRCGMAIPAIFASHGEDYFRQIESQEFATRLLAPGNSVLAVGGGAIELKKNRELLQSSSDTRAFYLEAPLAELLARCALQKDARPRPLLPDAQTLFERRADLYAGVGTPVSTFGFSAQQVADHIVSLLQIDNAL